MEMQLIDRKALGGKNMLEVIPNEILYYVFTFLDANQLIKCTRVNHLFYALGNHSTLWRSICERKWPDQFGKFYSPQEQKARTKYPSLRTIHCLLGGNDSSTFWKNYYIQKCYLEEKRDCLTWSQVMLNSSSIGTKPTSRYAHSGSVYENNVVYIGGQLAQKIRYNDIFFYNSESGQFTKAKVRGAVPNLSKHTAVEINGLFYIFGGYDGLSQRFELAVFDPKRLVWENPTTFGDNKPASRSNHAAAAIGDNMYIFGGLLQQDNALVDANDLYVLNTKTMAWSKPEVRGDVPEVRCGHKLVAVDDKLYMFGGGNGDNWNKKFNTLHIYDPETCTWTLPETTGIDVDSTTFASVFVVGKFLFVFGGGKMSHRGQVSNELFAFDTVTHHWTKQLVAGDHIPVERDDCTTNVVGDAIYFMHGYNSGPIDEFWSMKMHPSFYRAAFQKDPPIRASIREYGLSLSPSLRKVKQRLSQLTLSPFSRRATNGRS